MTSNHRTLSDRGKLLLGSLEGVRTTAYRDVAGLWTIGVGHLLTRDELSSGKLWIAGQPIRWELGLTDAQVAALLAQDLRPTEETVNLLVKTPITQNQFDALVLFAFNVGREAFAKSSLLRRLNEGKPAEVPGQLQRWVYAAGQRVAGLANRRAAEARLWSEGAAV